MADIQAVLFGLLYEQAKRDYQNELEVWRGMALDDPLEESQVMKVRAAYSCLWALDSEGVFRG